MGVALMFLLLTLSKELAMESLENLWNDFSENRD